MKSQEITAATLVRGLFNSRALRAASLLSVFGTGSLLAAETSAQPVEPVKAPVVANGETAETTRTIEPTVVIASRHEEKLADVSPSVSLVTKEEIETRQFRTLGEVLQSQPGVEVSGANQQPGQIRSIFTRGTNSNQTALMLDGRRLNPGFSNSYELQRYSTAGLGSVEFMRGASSTLYGANAIGGVVDMRTVDPLRTPDSVKAEAEAGSFGYRRGVVAANGSTVLPYENGDTAIGASAAGSWTKSDGPVANSDYRGGDGLFRIDAKPVESLTFETIAQVQEAEYGNPGARGGFGGFPNLVDRQIDRGWLVSPGVRFDNTDGVRSQLFYSASHSEVDAKLPAFFSDDDSLSDRQEVSFQTDWDVTGWALLSAGFNYEQNEFRKVDNATRTETFGRNWESLSPWARGVLHTRDDASKLGAGVRYQDFDDFKDAVTGEVFGSHAIRETGTSFHAKVATAYSAPRANDYAFLFGAPAPNLKPEQSVSYEVGAKQKVFEKTSPAEFSVVVFENRIQDILGFSNATFTTFNGPEAHTRGVELTADWKPVKQLRLFANGTIQQARYDGANATFSINDGDRLLLRPTESVTAGFEVYPSDTVTLGFSGTGVMGREGNDPATFARVDLGDYFVARVYGSWRFHKNAEVFGRVENLFDENYDSYNKGFEGLPLGAYAGLRVRF